jgi:hypothetical protein
VSVEGSWLGTYRQTWPSAGEPVPIRLRLSQSFWGRVRGTVTAGPPQETYLTVEAFGRSLLGKVSLTLDYRTSVPSSFAPPKADGPFRFPT